jgi:hypothetical protein
MTMDDNTPEPQDTADPAGQQDFNDTTTMATPTASAAPPKARKALSRPWTWVGIAAAALLLGGEVRRRVPRPPVAWPQTTGWSGQSPQVNCAPPRYYQGRCCSQARRGGATER